MVVYNIWREWSKVMKFYNNKNKSFYLLHMLLWIMGHFWTIYCIRETKIISLSFLCFEKKGLLFMGFNKVCHVLFEGFNGRNVRFELMMMLTLFFHSYETVHELIEHSHTLENFHSYIFLSQMKEHHSKPINPKFELFLAYL